MTLSRARRAPSHATALLCVLALAAACSSTDPGRTDAAEQLPGAGDEPAWWESVRVDATSSSDTSVDEAQPLEPGPEPDLEPEPDPEPGTDVTVPADVGFETGSSTLEPEIRAMFEAFGTCLADATIALTINGHADGVGGDSVGGAARNRRLSKDRAEAVATVLTDAGVDRNLIRIRGHGDDRPVADEDGDDPDEARARNRRVTMTVLATKDCSPWLRPNAEP